MTTIGKQRTKANTKGGVRSGRVLVRRVSRFLATLAGVLWALVFYYTPALAVGKVDVTGTRALDAAAIKSSLALEGEGLLGLDIMLIEKELLKEPRVKAVDVRRWLPGTVYINIKERPEAALWLVGSDSFVVDLEGVVLGRSGSNDNIPNILDRTGVVPEPGDRVSREAVLLASKLMDEVPNRFGTGLKSFEYLGENGLSIITATGWRAVFGGKEDLEFKLDSL
ncbi:MAG: FtsQ-type POTRA domain-containing protein, partial [Dehalococcoidia bacterium]|nr:FtsQ-type POTRA domain-containing protein [Dehalococcoidia bacterium]